LSYDLRRILKGGKIFDKKGRKGKIKRKAERK